VTASSTPHISSPHRLATRAGERVIAAGGSAVDGAIATAAVLTVVYPHMVSLGGDAWALVSPTAGEVVAVNGSGSYAHEADPAALRVRHGRSLPTYGIDTVTVPGGVAAWRDMHARWGVMPWADLFVAAIALAREGVTVPSALAREIRAHVEMIARDPGLASTFLDDSGKPIGEGTRLVQPVLARTLTAVASDGAQSMYGGAVGAAFVEGVRNLGSSMNLDDLAAHQTEFVEPIRRTFRSVEVVTSPPNSQGFVLLQLLAAFEQLNLTGPVGDQDPAVVARLFSLSNAERARLLADPRIAPLDVDAVLSDDYIAELVAHAKDSASVAWQGEGAPRPDGDTVAIVAMDGEGSAVTLIQSIFFAFGAMLLEPSTGIVLQNRGTSLSLSPTDAARLEPGARPPHTLMPVMLFRDSKAEFAVGTMGGQAQAQIQAQLIQRLELGEAPDSVVGNARWAVGPYGEGTNDHIMVEGRLSASAVAGLQASGLPLVRGAAWDDRAGHSQILQRIDGAIRRGTDPRADARDD